MDQQGLRVGKCVSLRAFNKPIELHAGHSFQGAAKLVSLPITADGGSGIDRPNTEGNEVIEDGAGAARLAADAHHIVDRKVRFDGGFLKARIDLKVAVQADIPDQADFQLGEAGGDLVELARSHGYSKRLSRAKLKNLPQKERISADING
jgi:hypothetical protein